MNPAAYTGRVLRVLLSATTKAAKGIIFMVLWFTPAFNLLETENVPIEKHRSYTFLYYNAARAPFSI